MSNNTREDDENDERYSLSLKEVEQEILQTLKGVSKIKSKSWNVDVKYKPDMISYCKRSNLCEDRCDVIYVCRYYRRIRRLFQRYGFLLLPYSLFKEGLPLKTEKIWVFMMQEQRM